MKSLARLFMSLLGEVYVKPITSKNAEEKIALHIQSLMIFAVPWSLGSTITGKYH